MSLDFLKSPVFMRVCAGCANGNEATATLDKESIARLMTCLQERKNDSVIIMVSHDPYVLAQCDAVLDICSIQHSNPD